MASRRLLRSHVHNADQTNYRDGFRYTAQGFIHRYLCRLCGVRFSESLLQRKEFNVSKQTGPSHSSSNLAKGSIRDWDLTADKLLNDGSFSLSENVGSHTVSARASRKKKSEMDMVEEKAVFHIHQHSHTCTKRQNAEGKSVQHEQAAQPPKQPLCPQCRSSRLYKDGLRYTSQGSTQRWLCRDCGLRFSQSAADLRVKINVPGKTFKGLDSQSDLPHVVVSKFDLSGEKILDKTSLQIREYVGSHEGSTVEQDLNRLRDYNRTRRVCASEKAKNLDNQAQYERPSVGGTNENALDIKGKLVEFAWWMEKQGYSKETIRGNLGCLRALHTRNGNLLDPESIKNVMAKEQKWSQNRRRNIANSYTLFLKINGVVWEKPKIHVTRKFPFIPTEQELNSLISGCGMKTSTFLLLLKETAMRSGEAKRIQWTNIDTEKNIVTLNDPEKGSNPRMWRVTPELIGMLNMLPKKSTRVFGDGPINSLKSTFTKARKRLAIKLQNPRLLEIHFHTFRHWKATMLYHKTKDPYYVKDFLGHKCLSSTEIYINIERTLFEDQTDEFTVKVAEKQEDIKVLLETGFEYVCQKDNLVYLRKRK